MNTLAANPKTPARWRHVLLRGVLATLLLCGGVVAWQYLTCPLPSESVSLAAEIAGRKCAIISEVFLPQQLAQGPQRFPAVVLLHGIEGGERYRRQRYLTADRLRDEGFAVFIVHYFGAVDYPDLWKFKSDGSVDHDAIERQRRLDQAKWVAGVTCALQQISRRSDVDPQRIALDGYSLGGFIALSATQESIANPDLPDVNCLVVNWGAMFRDVKFSRGFPPSLFVHGEQDQVVLLRFAEQTIAALKETGAMTSLCVVPGAGHRAMSAETERRTLTFLSEQLQADK